MDLISLVITLIVLGLVWWLLTAYILPHVPEPLRTIIIVLLIVIVILWLLSLVGVLGSVRLGK
jgi:hypothetical protein